MEIFKTENAAFSAGGDATALFNRTGFFPNCGFRVLKKSDGFAVIMVPDRRHNRNALPFYLRHVQTVEIHGQLIEFGALNYSGHRFSDFHVRRDPATGPGFYIFGRNSEKYGTKENGQGAYVKLCARPYVKPRAHRHYNSSPRAGWRKKADAFEICRVLNSETVLGVQNAPEL